MRAANRSEGRRLAAARLDRAKDLEETVLAVDDADHRLAQDRIGVRVQDPHARRQIFRLEKIVMGGPFEILARCQLVADVEIG
jgi:hypothetical protein